MKRTASLATSVRRALREGGLLDGCRCLLLGVSGGADSVAMAHLLRTIVPARGPRLVIAHLHHGIRGATADRDAAFVLRLAADLGLDAVSGRADVPAFARARGESLEMAARVARHEFFRRAAADAGADRVMLAHTADDQAETVLLRLCRGAGSTGLSAMKPDTRIGGLRIVRPMLCVGRGAVEAYLRSHGIRWRTDPTNADDRHLRNRVRRRVLPMLERELNPSVREALRTAAGLLGAEDEWMESAARKAFARLAADDGSLDARRLVRLPVALQRRVVLLWVRAAGLPVATTGLAAVERVRSLAAGAGALAPLGAGWTATVSGGRLFTGRRIRKPGGTWSPVTLAVPGATDVPGAGLRVVAMCAAGYECRPEPGPGAGPTVAWLDAERLGSRRLTIRPWRPGDGYRPLGSPGTAKIHDILVDRKVPRERRAGLPVVVCGRAIVWLPGHRVAEGWQVCGRGLRSLQITIRKADAH